MGNFVAGKEGHLFASSVAEWRTGTDLDKLVKAMKKGGYPFRVIWVPLPPEAHYKISDYLPEVEGCVLIAKYDKK